MLLLMLIVFVYCSNLKVMMNQVCCCCCCCCFGLLRVYLWSIKFNKKTGSIKVGGLFCLTREIHASLTRGWGVVRGDPKHKQQTTYAQTNLLHPAHRSPTAAIEEDRISNRNNNAASRDNTSAVRRVCRIIFGSGVLKPHHSSVEPNFNQNNYKAIFNGHKNTPRWRY